jgi:uracil-DNA glycosylase
VSIALAELREQALACTRCPLAELGRTQVVFGVGNPDAELLFVGEGPGAEEDRLGEPFVGRSGKLLDRLLAEELGMDRSECYIANVVKCRPPDNRDPRPDEVTTCRGWLERQIELIEPRVIVTLGRFAGQLLLDSDTPITKLRGRAYPWGDAVVVPTVHPAYALRGGAQPLAHLRADLVRAKQHLVARPEGAPS